MVGAVVLVCWKWCGFEVVVHVVLMLRYGDDDVDDYDDVEVDMTDFKGRL